MTESEIGKKLKDMNNGDENAFNEIYYETHNKIHRTIAMMIYQEQDIEDILNEVYVQMWHSIDKYDYTSSFWAWLYGITMKQISNFKRKNWRFFRIVEKEKFYTQKTEMCESSINSKMELKENFMYYIGKLNDKQKAIIILRYYHQYSFKEISVILKIPINTAKSRHRLAIEKLRHNNVDLIYLTGEAFE